MWAAECAGLIPATEKLWLLGKVWIGKKEKKRILAWGKKEKILYLHE